MRLQYVSIALELVAMNINIKLDNKNMAIYKRKFKLLSVCLSKILEFHNKWLESLENHCICMFTRHIFEMFQDLSVAEIKWQHTADTDTATQTDCYNPPPTLGLIIFSKIKFMYASIYMVHTQLCFQFIVQ